MKTIKPMNSEEFAKYLLTLKPGDCIDFGCYTTSDKEEITDNDVECWYFAKVMEIPEYGSRFILLDYAGGEEAYAIPLNNYKNCCDEDDKYIVPKYVEEYFRRNGNIFGIVYVEMEELK